MKNQRWGLLPSYAHALTIRTPTYTDRLPRQDVWIEDKCRGPLRPPCRPAGLASGLPLRDWEKARRKMWRRTRFVGALTWPAADHDIDGEPLRGTSAS
jgi:hypothetical protein